MQTFNSEFIHSFNNLRDWRIVHTTGNLSVYIWHNNEWRITDELICGTHPYITKGARLKFVPDNGVTFSIEMGEAA